MYETEEAHYDLITKSPASVYYCLQHGYVGRDLQTEEIQSWYSKLKEWFLPSQQAYPLPPYSPTSKKFLKIHESF